METAPNKSRGQPAALGRGKEKKIKEKAETRAVCGFVALWPERFGESSPRVPRGEVLSSLRCLQDAGPTARCAHPSRVPVGLGAGGFGVGEGTGIPSSPQCRLQIPTAATSGSITPRIWGRNLRPGVGKGQGSRRERPGFGFPWDANGAAPSSGFSHATPLRALPFPKQLRQD